MSQSRNRNDIYKNQDKLGEPEKLLIEIRNLLPKRCEVYYRPSFNGLRPDIFVLNPDHSAIIIQIEDGTYLHPYLSDVEAGKTHPTAMSPYHRAEAISSSILNLHIEGGAEAIALNNNHNKLIKTLVYFTDTVSELALENLKLNERKIRDERALLNKNFDSGELNKTDYDLRMDYLERQSAYLMSDRGKLTDAKTLGKRLSNVGPQVLFTNEVTRKFKQYLNQNLQSESFGGVASLGKLQSRLSVSAPEMKKVKGSAGTGKTVVLANRAIAASTRINGKVLILTFNISLRNYIERRLKEVGRSFDLNNFDIINYHSFISDAWKQAGINQLTNETGEADETSFNDKLYSRAEMFEGREKNLSRYSAIFIDEAQDWEGSWIKIIRDNFLSPGGEMVLFADAGQNIYERDVSKARPAIVQGFGDWERLTQSYRSKIGSPLTKTISGFRGEYLSDKYDFDTSDINRQKLRFEGNSQKDFFVGPDLIQCHQLEKEPDWSKLAIYVHGFMDKHNLRPSEVCILGPEIRHLRSLEKAYRILTGEGTETTFESQEVYEELEAKKNDYKVLQQHLKKIRRNKKLHFRSDTDFLKLSTIHSFKGLESDTIFTLLGDQDSPEIVYTAITRARRNLVVFPSKNSEFIEFFTSHSSEHASLDRVLEPRVVEDLPAAPMTELPAEDIEKAKHAVAVLNRKTTKIVESSKSDDDRKVREIILAGSAVCAATAAQPIPFADIFILTPIQAIMGAKIGAVRGVPINEGRANEILVEIGGVIGLGYVAQQIAIGGYKTFIPFLGGFMTMPLVFGLTFAIGRTMDAYLIAKSNGQEIDKKKLRQIWVAGQNEGKQSAKSHKVHL